MIILAVKKVFVSLPMRGYELNKIRIRQADIFLKFIQETNDSSEYEMLYTLHEGLCPPDGNRLWYLAKSIEVLGTADLVIFSHDWFTANGCRVEHMLCDLYKIPYYYEKIGGNDVPNE